MESTLERIRVLSEEIGPRRPCSAEERRAAEWLCEDLRSSGVSDAHPETFRGYPTFGLPFGVITGAAVAAGVVPRRLGSS